MLTKTALRSPAYLARIKAVVVQGVRASNAIRGAEVAVGQVDDRRKRPSLRVVVRRGGIVEFFDRQDRDVTETVLAALRTWHAEQRRARPPLMEVRHASPSEWVAACERAGDYLLGVDRVCDREAV